MRNKAALICKHILLLMLITPALSVAAHGFECADPIGYVVSVKGKLKYQPVSAAGNWASIHANDQFCVDETISTDGQSQASIFLYEEKSVIRMDVNTSVRFQKPRSANNSFGVKVKNGLAYFFSRTSWHLEIDTPHVDGGIDGTEVLVLVDEKANQSGIIVFEGTYRYNTSDAVGWKLLHGNEAALFDRHHKPLIVPADEIDQLSPWRNLVSPLHAIQWVMYIPPVASLTDNPDKHIRSVERQLRLGHIEAATTNASQIRDLSSRLAYQALIQLIRSGSVDEDAQAMEMAQRAFKLNENSQIAALVYSYALQSAGQLSSAIGLLTALKHKNALLHTRLAELHLATGDLANAKENSARAVESNANFALAHSMNGYVWLGYKRYKKAEESFDTAVHLDGFLPEAYLGRGLTKIARGKLSDGRVDIELAVAQDPNFALSRLYLARAYFEEAQFKRAATQYDLAGQIDPYDPQIAKLKALTRFSQGGHLEALDLIDQSTDLNRERKRFRSENLLVGDQASNGTLTASIYNRLNLIEHGINEASLSIARAPLNYASYSTRFHLYGAEPVRDQIRASDILTAKLLKPISTDIIPASLQERELFVYANAFASQYGLNSYETAFNSDGLAGQSALSYGTNNSVSDQFGVAVAKGRSELGASQLYYETEGFRTNADVRHFIWSAHAAHEIAPGKKLRFEYRKRVTDQGDITLNFDPNNFSNTLRQNIDHSVLSGGASLEFPKLNTAFLFNVSREKLSSLGANSTPSLSFKNETQAKGVNINVQNIFRDGKWSIVSGIDAQIFKTRAYGETDISPSFGGTCPIFVTTCILTTDKTARDDAIKLYTYWTHDTSRSFQVTLGANSTYLDGIYGTEIELHPKIGLHYEPNDLIELSFSYHPHIAQSPIIGAQLEPSHIFDNPQHKDAPNRSRANAFTFSSLGKTQKHNLFFGANFERISLDIPVIDFNANMTNYFEVSTSTAELFFNKLFGDFLLASLKSKWLRQDYNFNALPAAFNTQIDHLTAVTAPLRLSMFHKGSEISVIGTPVYQHIEEATQTGTQNAQEFLFTLDAKLTLRPKYQPLEISLIANNLLDASFNYQDPNYLIETPSSTALIPERQILLTTAFHF